MLPLVLVTSLILLVLVLWVIQRVGDLADRITEKEGRIMAGIDDILVKLEAETTVVASVAVGVDAAIAKLKELRDLVAAGANDPAKVQQALDSIDASTAQLVSKRDELGVAVETNT